MIRAGSLKHRIYIMTNKELLNEYGEVINKWKVSNSTRASIAPYTGNETFSSSVKNTVSHKIIINGKIKITPDNQIVFNNRVFKIIYILNWNETNTEKLILAIEKIEKLNK